METLKACGLLALYFCAEIGAASQDKLATFALFSFSQAKVWYGCSKAVV